MSVFVAIRTDQHNAEWLQDFAVMVADMAAYDTFYRMLIAKLQLTDVSPSFAMEEIKYTTALPLLKIN